MPKVPATPKLLGFAGVLPQAACVAAILLGGDAWRYGALAIAAGYAGLILSFVGGMWWGIAASRGPQGETAPDWLWLMAVAPSLIALAAYLPWVFGYPWPGPSLVLLGLALMASLGVDRALRGMVPAWWMQLRVPLSVGLGGLTVAAGLL